MKIAVLISGSGSNLQAFIDDAACGKLSAEIAMVVSNRADAFGLQRATDAGIATTVVDHKAYQNREDFDRALLDALVPIEKLPSTIGQKTVHLATMPSTLGRRFSDPPLHVILVCQSLEDGIECSRRHLPTGSLLDLEDDGGSVSFTS